MIFPLYDDNPVARRPVVTIGLIALNLICFVYVASLGLHDQREFITRHAFIPARLNQLQNHQQLAINLYPLQLQMQGLRPPPGKPVFLVLPPDFTAIALTTVTSLFLHGGWLHVISNMWFLWIFGDNIEDRLGHVPFLIFYLLGGVIATLTHSLMSGGNARFLPVIGASGAVAATLGAYAVSFPFARVRALIFIIIYFTIVDLPALLVLGFFFLVDLSNGIQRLNPNFVGGGVAFWAHVGGFVAGAAAIAVLGRKDLISARSCSDPFPSRSNGKSDLR